MMDENRRRGLRPGQCDEFPPWFVSAYGIARKHGYTGTEREFREALRGKDGTDEQPMVLVTEEPEAEIGEEWQAYMRPSGDEYVYYTEHNEFRMADRLVSIPDGLAAIGQTLRLTCEGEAYGTEAQLPPLPDVLANVTSADNGKILVVRNGEWTAGGLSVTRTVEDTDDVHITDAAAAPARELKISIEYAQSGWGTPSSENIRPIFGKTRAVIYRAGENVFTAEGATDGYAFDPDGDPVVTEGKMITDYFEVNGAETMLCEQYRGYDPDEPILHIYHQFVLYDADKVKIGRADFEVIEDSNVRFAARIFTEGAAYIRASEPSGFTAEDFMMASERTWSADWPETGIVYGGTLNVGAGVLTLTHRVIDSYAGETLPGEWISDRDEYAAGTSPSTGAQVVYALAEPEVIRTGSEMVTLLEGENRIWADSGKIVKLVYQKG
jgi:hypothetical protein